MRSASSGRLGDPSFPHFWWQGEGGSILEGKPKLLRIENKWKVPQEEGSESPPSPISEGRGRGNRRTWNRSKNLEAKPSNCDTLTNLKFRKSKRRKKLWQSLTLSPVIQNSEYMVHETEVRILKQNPQTAILSEIWNLKEAREGEGFGSL